MDDVLRRLTASIALAVALAPTAAVADAALDQYAVAAGHYSRARWQLAVDEFDLFLDRYPDHERRAPATFFSGEALVQLGRYADARERFQSYLDQFAEGRFAREAMFRVGEASYLAGDRAAAAEPLERFLATYPDDELIAYVLPYLGDLALAAGELDDATAHYTAGMARFPQGPLFDDCRYGLARTLQERGEWGPAKKLFSQLYADPQHRLAADAQFQLAAIDYSRGDFETAERSLTTFVDRWPGSTHRDKALLARGWSQFQLARYDDAERSFAPLVDSPSVATEAQYWLALVHKARDEYGRAAELLAAIEQELIAEPQQAAIRYHLADSLRRSGQPATAGPLYDEILSAEPASDWADEALLGKIHVAAEAHRHDEIDELASRFHAEHANSPWRVEVIQLHVRSQLDRKFYAEAAGQLEPLVDELEPGTGATTSRYLLALAYLGLERFADAESALVPIDEADPLDIRPNIDLALGTARVGQDRFQDAIEPLTRCWEQRPTGDAAARCLAQWSICLARTGKFDDARQRYQQLVDDHADHTVVTPTTVQLAEAAYAGGQRRWSAELFAKLGRDDEQPELAARGLAGVAWNLFKQGQLLEASVKFQELLDRFPDQPEAAEAALARGQLLERLAEPDAALAMYHLVIDRYAARPQLPQALLHAARLHDRLRQQSDALPLYERLATDHADLSEADAVLYEWAWSLHDAGRAEEAEQVFDRLRREHPQSQHFAEVTYRLAEAAFKANRLDEADDLLAESLAVAEQTPVRQHALYLQSRIAAHREHWADVTAPLQTLRDEFPDGSLSLRAGYWMAEAEYRQGHYDVAAEQLDALIAQLPQPPEPWMAMVILRRAQTHGQLEQWHEARELAEQIATTFPRFEQQYEADYLLGRCHASRAEFELAREAYQRVVASTTGGETETAAMAQWMIGETYFHQKDLRAAVREYLRVEVLYAYPIWQAAALLQAGKCYERLDRRQQAVELYTRILREFNETQFADEAARRLRTATARAGTNKS